MHDELLGWYAEHGRDFPWRHTHDPYAILVSEVMLQQTQVPRVLPRYLRWLERWPTAEALAMAEVADVIREWDGLGYNRRAVNLHRCAATVVERGGFPRDQGELRTLPGIGPYTAAAIAAIAFDASAAAIDGNVERVVARLFALEVFLPAAKPDIRRLTAGLVPARRAGDFAQALMDLGATICTPKKPACALCPWMEHCAARVRGHPERFPLKAPKKDGRLRRGAAFVVFRADGFVLVRSRPPKGLLGGMTEVPTNEWSPDFEVSDALRHAPALARATPKWLRRPGVVTHVFTHFPLELTVYTAEVGAKTPAPAGMRWVALADLPAEALPNVMRKVLVHAGALSG